MSQLKLGIFDKSNNIKHYKKNTNICQIYLFQRLERDTELEKNICLKISKPWSDPPSTVAQIKREPPKNQYFWTNWTILHILS